MCMEIIVCTVYIRTILIYEYTRRRVRCERVCMLHTIHPLGQKTKHCFTHFWSHMMDGKDAFGPLELISKQQFPLHNNNAVYLCSLSAQYTFKLCSAHKGIPRHNLRPGAKGSLRFDLLSLPVVEPQLHEQHQVTHVHAQRHLRHAGMVGISAALK